MKQILIPNGTGPSNVGDMVILDVLEKLIRNSFPKTSLIIHSTEPNKYISKYKSARHTLYSYVAFDSHRVITKMSRFLRLWLYYIVFKSGTEEMVKRAFGKDKLFELCTDYKNSEIIIFVGGGYLRSKPGVKQTLNLLMQLFMIEFSKIFSNTKIISPISFGPFAYKWQEILSARVLKGIDVIAARESISFRKLQNNHVPKIILLPDHALLLNLGSAHNTKAKRVIGFTLREWFAGDKQRQFELEVAKALIDFSVTNKYAVQPILQVDSPKFGDADKEVSERIIRMLKNGGVEVKALSKVSDLKSIKKVYASIDMLLGMRMHSNILAAICGTPFVAIAYEYKTDGIVESLGAKKFYVKAEDVQSQKLASMIRNLEKQLPAVRSSLAKNLSKQRSLGVGEWERIFKDLN